MVKPLSAVSPTLSSVDQLDPLIPWEWTGMAQPHAFAIVGPPIWNNLPSIHCIVLYLYIYIAFLAVYTNQKRFQCERPREKRAVLRERKEALGSPVINKR